MHTIESLIEELNVDVEELGRDSPKADDVLRWCGKFNGIHKVHNIHQMYLKECGTISAAYFLIVLAGSYVTFKSLRNWYVDFSQRIEDGQS